MLAFDDFRPVEVETGAITVFVRMAGSGPPLLLLHGFPQTHRMWRDVAPLLARDFTVICADLPGYGRSGCPADSAGGARFSKRALANDLVAAMARLGHDRFLVGGHDRGGRVAYRMALDHPDRITAVAVLDIVPTEAVWEHADARFAQAYWPWTLLAQAGPLPERILAAAADAIVDAALDGWGSAAAAFPPAVRAHYVEALRDSQHAHAICQEYRAAATIDREHDVVDRAAGRQIRSPLLALWSARGPVGIWYGGAGGPLALWRQWASDVRGHGVEGGHFFPEEMPGATADALSAFFRSV